MSKNGESLGDGKMIATWGERKLSLKFVNFRKEGVVEGELKKAEIFLGIQI